MFKMFLRSFVIWKGRMVIEEMGKFREGFLICVLFSFLNDGIYFSIFKC